MPDTNVLIIAYHFPPENTVGALRPYRFFKYLKRLGYRCHVITASEQASSCADVTFIRDPSRDFLEFGHRNGPLPYQVQIERFVRKIFLPGHLGTTWSRAAATACNQIIDRDRETRTVLFSTYPPFGAHLAGLQIARRKKIPWIADFRDPMALDPMLYKVPPLCRKTLSFTERSIIRRASCILVTVNSARDAYGGRYPWAREKFEVIWNGFDPETQPSAKPPCNRSVKVLIHAGSLYYGRNANVVIESVGRLRKRSSVPAKSLLIRLVGEATSETGIDEESYTRAIEEGWLEMPKGWMSQPDALRMTEEADALLLLQPQSKVQVPGKLFEYICIGRPILATVPPQSAVEWVLAHSGVPYTCVYTTDSPEQQDSKIERFLQLDNAPTAASNWFRQHFDVEQQTRELAGIINSL